MKWLTVSGVILSAVAIFLPSPLPITIIGALTLAVNSFCLGAMIERDLSKGRAR